MFVIICVVIVYVSFNFIRRRFTILPRLYYILLPTRFTWSIDLHLNLIGMDFYTTYLGIFYFQLSKKQKLLLRINNTM